MIKQDMHTIKGMQKDLSVSKASNEFVFDAYNIRITARENNTLFSVTNEKGNLEQNIYLAKPGVVGNLISTVNNGLVSAYPVASDVKLMIQYTDTYSGEKGVTYATISKGTSYTNVLTNFRVIYNIVIISEDIDDRYVYYTVYDDSILNISKNNIIPGTYLGNAVINKYLIVFSKDDKYDYIHRFEFKDTIEWKVLYHGNLNLSTDNPIETLTSYESEDIQKVYWVDGLNQTRYINIVAPIEIRKLWNDNSFDFVQKINLFEKISVSRSSTPSGAFSPGVIQYAFTYYNLYGSETNIFYTSELHYITYDDRGAAPDEKVNVSFNIDIIDPDKNFDYIRIYSIQRSSIDATPIVTRVVDLPINKLYTYTNYKISYVDNGSGGDIIDATELLYKGGQNVVFKTLTQKDNTLFLGNIKLDNKLIDSSIKKSLVGNTITFESKDINYKIYPKGSYYEYNSNLGETTFKYLEWYRFGLQFQSNNGKWSEPIFIKDAYNDKPQESKLTDSITTKLVKAYLTLDSDVINKLVDSGFVRARGVIVFPESNDREVIAQGILCPTVYNVGDRFDNAPFAQASWFSRPNAAFDYEKSLDKENGIGDTDIFENSPKALFSDSVINSYDKPYINVVNYGSWAEFRHNKPIPDNGNRNAEIQCISSVPDNYPYSSLVGSELRNDINNYQENFYVDQSIVTLHSPDIEFTNLKTDNLKLRIVGIIPITSNASDIDIQTKTPAFSDSVKYFSGFYKEFIGSKNFSYHGYKSLISGAFWMDNADENTDIEDEDGNPVEPTIEGYLVYPWHRNGSLNWQDTSFENRSALLASKKLSNLKYSAYTKYFSPWYSESKDDNHNGITKVNIFNSDHNDIVQIPEPENSNLGKLNYYGNIDKIVTPSRMDLEVKNSGSTIPFNKKDGYPIVLTYFPNWVTGSRRDTHNIFSNPLKNLFRASKTIMGTDPVSIKYKSTPHAVFAFNYTKDGKQVILPTHKSYMYGEECIANDGNVSTNEHFFWNTNAKTGDSIKSDGVYQDVISQILSNTDIVEADNYGYLYIGELYNDNVVNRFGGTSEEALENNKWLPAGEPVSLISGYDIYNNPTAKTSVKVEYTEGDTYYQRYDCLKTYPYTLEDLNSIVEIVSFMCETRVNIDGRYDRNRGLISNLYMTPSNFNKINDVYTQKNNFFNYRGINENRFNLNYFPNTITWTKEKSNTAIIDAWTNITVASTLDLDGSKGEITSLNTFNDNIICFQDGGISNILFNSRVQIPVSDGVPIEISNGLKVEGKRYINESIGCNNKWSIVESPNGIYFIDNITASIYLFNGKLEPITDKGLSQWIGQYRYTKPWNSKDFNNFISFYDISNGDVYFTHNNACLCFSETLNQFTSFMSYEEVPAMFNIHDKFFSLKKGKLWEQFAGDYNMFYNEFKPYSLTFISNPDEPYDKIFDNIEFRADSWDNNSLVDFDTFDTLDVWNEYQNGHADLFMSRNRPSTLKKKFRVWRANIPRDITNPRDRIRNTWAYIKLSKNTPNTYRTEFHDLIVNYFV